ncbi:MAG TPA: DUF1186 domain-containing protein [Terriglobia bacterium]|nr:DUF1186 domain-containing protein [Terriglobia bacterium]
MDVPEILQRIERVTGRFEQEAVEAALAKREEVTPQLLGILQHTFENAKRLADDGHSMAHLYAMFLLSQFREPQAYPHLLRLCALPGDVLDSLCGDFITETLGRALASVCAGNTNGIRSVIENEDAGEWVRGAALDGLVTLVAEGVTERDATVQYFGQLFRTLRREPSETWNSLVAATCDLYPEELIEEIKQAYRDDLIDPFNISMKDVMHDLGLGRQRALARLASDRHHQFITDTIREFGSWYCFHRDEGSSDEANVARKEILASTHSRPAPKIGRNDPCPCGSGRKFKKCCLGK